MEQFEIFLKAICLIILFEFVYSLQLVRKIP
jgi:hypothetical protein